MPARSRTIIIIAGALAALVVLLLLHAPKTHDHIGMTAAPCAEDGTPITGKERDDWPGLCTFRLANARLLEKGVHPKVVMIGDSVTAYWPMPSREFANRGIGGQTSSQVLLRFQQDAIALKPQIIHILVGINDVTGLTGPVSSDMFQNNIRAMVEMARAHDIDVILGTIGPARDFDWRPKVRRGHWVPILNDWLVRYAHDQKITVADYHTVLSNEDGRMRDELFADSVHPNEKGYAAMKSVLFDAIEQTGRAIPGSSQDQSRSTQ